MFPLSDSIKAHHFPFLPYATILLTLYVFFLQITALDPDTFVNKYALIPATIDFTRYNTLIPFVSAIFLHGGIMHILSNMWFLFIFGDNVNDRLTPIGFLLLYLFSGVVGNLAQYFIDPTSTIPILGASGAVAGVLGAYFVLFPFSKVKTLLFIVFFVTIIELSAPILLGYWFVLQLFSGVGSLSEIALNQGGVAFFAHIAGFIVGYIFGKTIKRQNNY